jgi:hypothetical protein
LVLTTRRSKEYLVTKVQRQVTDLEGLCERVLGSVGTLLREEANGHLEDSRSAVQLGGHRRSPVISACSCLLETSDQRLPTRAPRLTNATARGKLTEEFRGVEQRYFLARRHFRMIRIVFQKCSEGWASRVATGMRNSLLVKKRWFVGTPGSRVGLVWASVSVIVCK